MLGELRVNRGEHFEFLARSAGREATVSDDEVRAGGMAAAALADEIRRRRAQAGLSQAQLAMEVGYTREYVSRAERVSKGSVSARLVEGIDRALSAEGALVELQARAELERFTRRSAARRGSSAADLTSPAGEKDQSGDRQSVRSESLSRADLLTELQRGEPAAAELINFYPDRASVPRSLWLRLLDDAEERVDVLVHSGTFFAQMQPRIGAALSVKMSTGVKVRLCFGDPGSDSVAIRDAEEGLGGTLAAKIRASLTYYRDVARLDGCDVRLHPTTLYASIFRYDDDMLVNPHAYGQPASLNPTYHFRRTERGPTFEHYLASFERVWATSSLWLDEEG